MGTLLKYSNVRCFFFQGEEEIITNLDNYKDYSHYGPWVNDTVSEYLFEGHGEVTKENYLEAIREMKEFVYSFDYGEYYAE